MIELFKLMFDLSYFYTLAGFFYALFSGHVSMTCYLILAGMIAADMLLRRFEGLPKAVRLLPLLIPFTVFFTGTGIADIVFMFFPSVYLGVSMATDRVFTDRIDFANESRLLLRILPVMILGFFSGKKAVTALEAIVPYAIIYLYAMIWLLRYLRNPEVKTRTQVLSAAGFAGFTLLCTLGRLPELLVKGLGLLYEYVIVPALTLFATGFGYLMMGIGWLIKTIFLPGGLNPVDQAFESEAAETGSTMEYVERDGIGLEFLVWIGRILVVLLILAAIYFLLRYLMGKRRAAKEEAGYTEEKGTAEGGAPRHSPLPRFRPFHPREAIRYDYARFLKEAAKQGMEFSKGATTLEIADRSAKIFPREAVEELRELYVLARYAPDEVITREEAARSAAAFRTVKHNRYRMEAQENGLPEMTGGGEE
ncbi:MAG: DUF4129 domain-containing protein [Lachnospiraceae bacterium]|nr:DUF4129 domain-containing protein [Lachnospiraceae bacterium]